MHELPSTHFDLIAIGSGPAGQRAAVQAAKLGKRAALIERGSALGGVSTNTGTVPSKTLRAAVVELTGRAASVYGNAFRVQHEITIHDLLSRTHQVIEHEQQVIADQLRRNGVRVFEGTASFADPHTLEVAGAGTSFRLTAERIVIAVGTTPARPSGVEFDERTVLDSDGILHLAELPRTLTVIGGGVIGLEYASMAAALGVNVTLVEKRPRILDFVDDELVEALQYHLRGLGLVLPARRGGRLGAAARERRRGHAARERQGDPLRRRRLRGRPPGRDRRAESRRPPVSRPTRAAGSRSDERYRTAQPHIFAAGDVIGFPSLAATSMEQGRLAALAAFDRPAQSLGAILPYGIYSIPEMSFVGPTERELTDDAVPYVVGLGRYRELARGEIAGDRTGLLKLLVHAGRARCSACTSSARRRRSSSTSARR